MQYKIVIFRLNLTFLLDVSLQAAHLWHFLLAMLDECPFLFFLFCHHEMIQRGSGFGEKIW